jgi:DNA-binding NarL/FixJ family response regulator
VVREGLKALLEREGFRIVSEASNGRDAIRAACERRPEVAILDLGMPVLNGIEAARARSAGALRACGRSR